MRSKTAAQWAICRQRHTFTRIVQFSFKLALTSPGLSCKFACLAARNLPVRSSDHGEWVMSFDGMSQDGTQSPPLARRAPNIDSFVRRSTAGDNSSVKAKGRRPNALGVAKGEQRHYSRNVPAANISQAALDLVMIGTAQLAFVVLIYSRLDLGGLIQALAVVGFSTFISLAFLYATGSYRRDALLSRSSALSRRVPTGPFDCRCGGIFRSALRFFPPYFRQPLFCLSVSRCVTYCSGEHQYRHGCCDSQPHRNTSYDSQ